jgi:5-methylcytosine-specific restriction endonuclease McrA
MKPIEFNYGSKDVQDLISLFLDNRLNLEPGFQRQSVWSLNDRKKLIQSIIQNYPVPSIFLYKTTDDKGRLKYDVLDGKQRLESIFMFAGLGRFRTQKFDLKISLNETDDNKIWDWKKLGRSGHEHQITGYRIQIVEVSGTLSDIIDLFVRINSTGKRLTGQEKRHARFYHSDFLKSAGQLGNRYSQYFIDNRILTRGLISRMKHVELICELMASIHMQQLLNKKTALDKIISGENINARNLQSCKADFIRILNLVKKIFPNLKTTRFAFSAEFYSLFMMIWELDKEKMILTDLKRNQQAQKLLGWMSNGVDELRTQISKAKGARPDQQLFASYLFTTRGDSDSSTTRKRRSEVLKQLFNGIFEKKDENRNFNKEQRRLLWNTDATRTCNTCGEKLTWENFTIDHIKPHSLGGPSVLTNAALMCRSCNSSKGKRRATKKSNFKLNHYSK